MIRLVPAATVLVLLSAAVLGGCGGDGGEPAGSSIDPTDFQAKVDNQFWPLASVGTTVLEGEERHPETGEVISTRAEANVLSQTEMVAGVEVTVVEVKEYEDGELIEVTLDYFAQHRDGTVYYFGERVDEYEGGEVVGHGGQWLAGEGENQPGVFMPAQRTMDQTFEQERAPGIAEDRSTVVALDQAITTPAGSFTGCIKTEDVNPLDNTTENKFYCPGVGLVREEFAGGYAELASYDGTS